MPQLQSTSDDKILFLPQVNMKTNKQKKGFNSFVTIKFSCTSNYSKLKSSVSFQLSVLFPLRIQLVKHIKPVVFVLQSEFIITHAAQAGKWLTVNICVYSPHFLFSASFCSPTIFNQFLQFYGFSFSSIFSYYIT